MNLVLRRFGQVLDTLDGFSLAPAGPDGVHFDTGLLLDWQMFLLSAMASHIDDCYSILKALAPLGTSGKIEVFVDRWLFNENHPSVRDFKGAIEPYETHLGAVFNDIKHNAGRLRSVTFHNDERRVIGYYLEQVFNDEGVLGPHPQVNPKGTAFSFNRDLRYLFCALYDIGHYLARAIKQALKVSYQFTWPTGVLMRVDSTGVESIAKRIGGLGTMFFPDECEKPKPFVQTYEEPTIVRVESRGSYQVHPPVNGMRIRTLWEGDGVSLAMKLPYFGTDQST